MTPDLTASVRLPFPRNPNLDVFFFRFLDLDRFRPFRRDDDRPVLDDRDGINDLDERERCRFFRVDL